MKSGRSAALGRLFAEFFPTHRAARQERGGRATGSSRRARPKHDKIEIRRRSIVSSAKHGRRWRNHFPRAWQKSRKVMALACARIKSPIRGAEGRGSRFPLTSEILTPVPISGASGTKMHRAVFLGRAHVGRTRTSRAADMNMPLRAYFVTVGPALLALLLFLNVILEPSKPDSPSPAAAALTAAVSNNTAKPRLTTGSSQPNGTGFLTAPAVESQRQTMSSPEPQLSTGEAEPKLVTQAKPRSKARVRTQNITAARRDNRSAYSSYTSASGAWNFSAATRHRPE